MDPRSYWTDYVSRLGGPKRASEHLAIPYSTIAGVCNGSRGIGRDLARRMAAADSSLDASVLLWVRPAAKAA